MRLSLDAHIAAVLLTILGLTSSSFIQVLPALILPSNPPQPKDRCGHARTAAFFVPFFVSLCLCGSRKFYVLPALVLIAALTPIDIPIRAPGVVRPQTDPIRIVSEAHGRIKKVYVSEGATVQTGSILVQLDPHDLLLMKRSLESRIHSNPDIATLYHELEQLHLNLTRLTITSPSGGRITSLTALRAGEMLSPGALIASLVPDSHDLVIESSLPSSGRSDVTPGRLVRLHSDSFPPDQYNSLEGTVLSISPDARVLITPSTYSPELHLGQTFTVHFITRRQRLLWLLFEKLRLRLDI